MNITVRITNNYGARAVYPVCPQAQLLAKLTGKVTLTPAALETIKALGYTVTVQQEAL